MRYIQKGAEPKSLREYKAKAVAARAVDPTVQITFRRMDEGGLRDELAREQGDLCGYTGKYLRGGGHVEHIKPVTCCKEETEAQGRVWGAAPEEDLDHHNLIAAVYKPLAGKSVLEERPGETPEERDERLRRDSYGAVKRQEEYREDMVKPTEPSCERRLEYLEDGQIIAAKADDEGAVWTITTLNLWHPELKEEREGAILGALYEPDPDDPTNPDEVLVDDATLQEIVDRMGTFDDDGRLPEYEFAIVQCAKRLLP